MNRNNAAVSPYEKLTRRINTARSTLLLVVALTVVNIVLTALNVDTYFLFSASVPFYMVALAMIFTGNVSDEIYNEVITGIEGFEPLPDTVLYVAIAIAAVIIAIYAAFYFLSKKNPKWLYGALVFMVIDTLFLFFMGGITEIIDIAFHIWIIVELILAVTSINKLASTPMPITEDGEQANPYASDEAAQQGTQPDGSDLNSSESYNLNGEDDKKQ